MEHLHDGPMAGRTVLVTGATSGIGKATALGLATMGAQLAITGPDRGRTEDAAREIRAAGGGRVDVFVADLSSQAERLLVPFLRPFMKTPARGAGTSIHLASAPELEQVSGRYFANSRPRRSGTRSHDEAVAARLWQVSADLVGLTATPRA